MHTNKKHSPKYPLEPKDVHRELLALLFHLTWLRRVDPEINMVIRSDFMEEYVSTQ